MTRGLGKIIQMAIEMQLSVATHMECGHSNITGNRILCKCNIRNDHKQLVRKGAAQRDGK